MINISFQCHGTQNFMQNVSVCLILLLMSLTWLFDVDIGFSHQFMAAAEHSLGNMILKIMVRYCQMKEVWPSRQERAVPKYTHFQKTREGVSFFRTTILELKFF